MRINGVLSFAALLLPSILAVKGKPTNLKTTKIKILNMHDEKFIGSLRFRGGASVSSPRAKSASIAIKPENSSGGGTGTEVSPDFRISAIIKGRWSLRGIIEQTFIMFKESRRLVYLASLALSLVYGYFFFFGSTPTCPQYSDGFCVTNFDGKSCPSVVPPGNSHLYAFYEDVIFTVIAIMLPFTKFSDANVLMRIFIPLVILSHGALHAMFGYQNCKLGIGGDISWIGVVFYSAFTWFLTLFTFLAMSDLVLTRGLPGLVAESVLITLGIVGLSLGKVEEGTAVTALFFISQLLVGYVGAFHPGPEATLLIAKTFVPVCIVSLIELLKCGWLAAVGGHAWYDFFLHISVLASLLKKSL